MSKKFETMFVVHVRYDINSEENGPASDIANLLTQSVNDFIKFGLPNYKSDDGSLWFNPSDYFLGMGGDVDSSEHQNRVTAKVTFVEVTDSIYDEASPNRHRPNVWFVGSLRNMKNSIRAYNANRIVSKFSRLADRVRQFDVLENQPQNPENFALPILPLPTMQLAISRLRSKEQNDINNKLTEQLQEEVLDILDGLFEDGLPITHSMTVRETRASSPEPF